MSKQKQGVKVFTLPGDECEANLLLNNELIEVQDMQKFPCPKEAVVLLYIYYLDYREGTD
jgi:hypothetical protein